MKAVVLALTGILLSCSVMANDEGRAEVAHQNLGVCLFAGGPPSDIKYQRIRKVKAAKGTYGSVREVLPKLNAVATSFSADAIINYSGSQRFGFWPWRFIRPVAWGIAVRLNNPKNLSCSDMGGITVGDVLKYGAVPQ